MIFIAQHQYILIGIINLVLGAIVLFNNYRRAVNLAFFLMSCSFAAWIISLHFLLNYSYDVMLVLRGRLVFTACILLPANILHFAQVYPRRTISLRRLIIIYILPLVLLPLTLTPLVIKDVKVNEWGLEPVLGAFYPVVLLYFVTYFITAIILFVRKYRTSNKMERYQIIYISIGFMFFIVFATLTNLILPLFGLKDVYKLGPWASIVLMSFILYTILKYRLLDIEIVIKRTSIYLVLVGVMSSLYAFIIMAPSSLIGEPGSPFSVFILVVATLIITLTIQPLRNWLDSITDKIFYQKKYDHQIIMEKIAKQLNSVIKLDDAYQAMIDPLINEMHLKGVGIYIREKAGDETYTCHERVGNLAVSLPEVVEESNPLINYLAQIQKYLEPGEFKYQYGHLFIEGEVKDHEKSLIHHEMENVFQAGLFLPLMLKTTMIGFLVLGEKKSGDQFTYRDLSLLDTIASQLVTAMDNIRLYEQMLNNERLTVIGTMSASIAHEIRNPLASIKTFIQMLTDKHEKPEFMEKFNKIVPAEIERISGITADLLTFSKPSSPSLEPVNIPNLLERVITLLGSQMRKRELKLRRTLTSM